MALKLREKPRQLRASDLHPMIPEEDASDS
jgi:hypothetical protein